MRLSFRLPFTRDETHQLVVMMFWIAAIHFVIEAVIMGTFSGWHLTQEVVVDGLLELDVTYNIVLSPLIYYFVAKPFIESARDAKQALNRELVGKAEQAARLEAAFDNLKHTLKMNEDLRRGMQSIKRKNCRNQ